VYTAFVGLVKHPAKCFREHGEWDANADYALVHCHVLAFGGGHDLQTKAAAQRTGRGSCFPTPPRSPRCSCPG
jgi:hypothetical protein